MSSNNIFKKYNQSDISFKKSELSEYKSNIYVPPAKRNITNVSTSQKSNLFLNNSIKPSLNYKIKSRPLYRVTEDKISSLEIFPELNKSEKVKEEKKEEKIQWIKQDSTSNKSVKCEKNNEEVDNTKLYVPDGWLLLSDLNKGKTISQIEKEREERYYNKQLEQYYVDMRYLMKERDAIKRKLYISIGEYFGYDSVILRDMPLKLDFLNESDHEMEDSNTDSDENGSILDSEDDYDEDARY